MPAYDWILITLFVYAYIQDTSFISACNCKDGAINRSCDEYGKCECKDFFQGEKCGECKPGYFNYPTCESMKKL